MMGGLRSQHTPSPLLQPWGGLPGGLEANFTHFFHKILEPELGVLGGWTRCQKILDKAPYHPKNRVQIDPLVEEIFSVDLIPLLPVVVILVLVGNNLDTPAVNFIMYFPQLKSIISYKIRPRA